MKSSRNHEQLLRPIGFTCKKVNRVWACSQNLCNFESAFDDESVILACVKKKKRGKNHIIHINSFVFV